VLRHGPVEVRVPPQWEGRLHSRRDGDGADRTVLHLANFAMPSDVAHYGGGAVEHMAPNHVFVSLLEFGNDSVGTALFERVGIPRLTTASFDPNLLQRGIHGQSGAQEFFSVGDRAYCLYVVVGSHALRWRHVPAVNHLLADVRLSS
jgi:hypothetical protein